MSSTAPADEASQHGGDMQNFTAELVPQTAYVLCFI